MAEKASSIKTLFEKAKRGIKIGDDTRKKIGAKLEKMVARYPMRRLGAPADAVGMIMFLLGDEATWITGQTFSVNGGYAIL